MKNKIWEIQPLDIHWNGFEASLITSDGWEPFGVTSVPNTIKPNQIRVWSRRVVKKKWKDAWEIKIQSVGWGGHQILLHLSAGWEPFGVADSFGNHIIWFRRRVDE